MSKRNIGKLIYYALGILLPFVLIPAFTHHCEPYQDLALILFWTVGVIFHVLSSRIAIKKQIIKQKVFSINFFLAAILWFLIGCLSSLSTPMCSYKEASIKNVLVNGVKECVVRKFSDQSTSFSDVNFKSTYGAFKIKSLDNSCFKAKAIPKSKSKTWFQIDYNSETGEVSKSCGDSSKYGCSKGNTW